MRRQIIYPPLRQRPRTIRRVRFSPLSQQRTDIGTQILGYLKTGKPLSPVIETKVIVPPETKTFIRNTIFTAAGMIVGGILLFRVLK